MYIQTRNTNTEREAALVWQGVVVPAKSKAEPRGTAVRSPHGTKPKATKDSRRPTPTPTPSSKSREEKLKQTPAQPSNQGDNEEEDGDGVLGGDSSGDDDNSEVDQGPKKPKLARQKLTSPAGSGGPKSQRETANDCDTRSASNELKVTPALPLWHCVNHQPVHNVMQYHQN